MKRNSETVTFTIDNVKFTAQLKNVYYNQRMSDETECYTADLVISYDNNILTWQCMNTGQGGATDVTIGNKNEKPVYNKINAYLGTIPNSPFIKTMKELYNMDITPEDYSYYFSMDSFVDALFNTCF